MDQETSDGRVINGRVDSVDVGTSKNSNSNSDNSVDQGGELETVIVISSDEQGCAGCVSGGTGDLTMKGDVAALSKVVEDKPKVKELKDEKHSCLVIDVKCGSGGGGGFGENLGGERVCRICHLSSDQSPESIANEVDLIQLGCGCKDELGIVHSHCAEAWFKLKGNRLCEICGETAKNITGVGDNGFMAERNDRRSTSSGPNSSDRSGGCWRGQPFCNFLLACLVIAFVLPWFLRVNMF